MSLGGKLLEGLDKAKAKAHEEGLDQLGERGEEGIDKVLDKGGALLEDVDIPAELKEAGREAIDIVRANKTPFIRLGEDGFARLLGHWEDADEAAARRHYLAHEATFAERRASMHAGTDQLIEAEDKAQAAEEAAWELAKEILQKVGTVGLQFLVTAAGAALGVPL